MSELDDLGEIADQCAVGNAVFPSKMGQHRRQYFCNSPDHMKGANVRVYRKGNNGKLRTVCRLCDKLRRRAACAAYHDSAEGYSL